jgi:hypothetical protein
VVCGSSAFAREEVSREFRHNASLGAGRGLRIEHRSGNVAIRGHAGNEAIIRATIRCSADTLERARRCADQVRVEVRETDAGLVVRTEYPDRGHEILPWRNLSMSADYDIDVPETAPLEVRNRFGGVRVSNARAGSIIDNSNGRVVFYDGRGTQRIENSFGPVEVARNDGDVTVENGNGQVTISDVTGILDVRGSFGPVKVSRAGRDVTVRNQNGAVEVWSAGGLVRVTNSFGEVTIADAKSDATVRNQNGTIEVKNVSGIANLATSFGRVRFSGIGKQVTVRAQNSAVTGEDAGGAIVETTFAEVDLRRIEGGVKVLNQNGSVTLRGVKGETFAETSFAGITVEDAGGPMTVANANGPVTLSAGVSKGCQPVSARTSFGAIRVAIPAGSAYDVSARTSFGEIKSEYEFSVTGAMSKDSLSGRIGAGGCRMELINQNGSVEILKDLRRRGNA